MLFLVAIVVSLFISVLVLAVSAFIAKRHALADLRKLPGQKPSVLFGNALQLEGEADAVLKRILGWMGELFHEGIMCLWLGPTYPLVLIYKPELVEVILNSSKHMRKAPDYDFLHPWLGTGLLTR
ncbi:hypothetical protein ACROYT_G030147 [Oculina patagonica]